MPETVPDPYLLDLEDLSNEALLSRLTMLSRIVYNVRAERHAAYAEHGPTSEVYRSAVARHAGVRERYEWTRTETLRRMAATR